MWTVHLWPHPLCWISGYLQESLRQLLENSDSGHQSLSIPLIDSGLTETRDLLLFPKSCSVESNMQGLNLLDENNDPLGCVMHRIS